VEKAERESAMSPRADKGKTTQQPKDGKGMMDAPQNSTANPVTPESFNKADFRLNAVYRQLMSNLSVSDQAKLKLEQREWVKLKEAVVKSSPQNSLKIQLKMTLDRIAELEAASDKK